MCRDGFQHWFSRLALACIARISGTKYETKADLLKFNSSYEKFIFFPDTTVRIHGKIALVTGKADFVHTATNISHVHVLHVWEKGPQGWQMIARQATKLP